MQSQKQRQLGEAGFSLIELMIVVAIIGILASIAIPNFNRFQAKAKQSEAKSNLAGIYTAEKSFYAEWNQYFADFRDIGFAPEGTLTYNVGFNGAGIAAPADPYNGPSTAGGAATDYNTTLAYAAGVIQVKPVSNIAPMAAVAANGSCTADAAPAGAAGAPGTFTAAALGDLHDSVNVGRIDSWTITQDRTLCNNIDGIN